MNKKSTKSKESMAETFPDFIDERIEQLKKLFPEVVSEGKIAFEKLRQSLGEIVDDRPERYSFTWAGKKDAIRLLQTPSRATLVPVPEESVNFDLTSNLFIEGDNLEVLKLLYKSYARRVKMIYIDPPYNTGNDFVYRDNFTDPLDTYLEITGQKDSNGNHLTSNTETNGRYHSAWLNMMYPRLFVARQLLREDGVIFVSIDDNEVDNLRLLMNEIFGEENQEAVITWRRRHNQPNDKTKMISKVAEFILVYARSSESLKDNGSFYGLPLTDERQSQYTNPDNDPNGPWDTKAWKSGSGQGGSRYTIISPTGKIFDEEWIGSEKTYKNFLRKGQIFFPREGDGLPRKKFYLNERLEEGQCAHNFWNHDQFGSNQEATQELAEVLGKKKILDNPKPVKLLKKITTLSTTHGDIILDFFAGSSTTAQAVLELNREDGGNRRFIMVQLPEPTKDKSPAKQGGFDTIADIGKERIRRVISRMHEEKNGELPLGERNGPEDLGFKVFELAESNFRQWTGVEEQDIDLYIQTMEMFIDPLLPDWKPENVRYEVARQEGYSLNATIEELTSIKTNTIHRVTDAEKDQFFYISLDPEFDLQTVKALELEQGLKREDLLIVRDVALTASLANNILQYCRLKTI